MDTITHALTFLLSHLFPILFYGVPFAGLIYTTYRRWCERNGAELVTIGKHESKITRYIGLYFALTAFCSLAQEDFGLDTIITFIFWGIISAGLLYFASSDIYVLKDGISQLNWQRTHWEDLGTYLWDNRDENRLILYKKAGGKIDMTIPKEKRDLVNQLLENHLETI